MLGIPLPQLVIVNYLLTESEAFTGNISDQDLAVLTERYISQYVLVNTVKPKFQILP